MTSRSRPCSRPRSASSRSDWCRPRWQRCRWHWSFQGCRCASVRPLTRSPALPERSPGPRLLAPRMPTPETIAARFARCLELFRDPAAKQAQKLEFRALLELLAEAPVTLKADAGRLEVNGVACEGKALTALLQRLDLHGVAEIALPQDPPPTQLFELFKALADQPDQEDLATRLGSVRADRISGTNAGGPPAPAAPPPEPITSAAPALPTSAPSGGGGAGALAELERNPAAPNAGDLLGAVIDQADMALKRNRPEEVLRLLAAILRVEQRVPEAGAVRRQYAIALRRICTRPVVEMLARLVTVPKHRTAATLALQRAGAEAVEVLLDLLVAAPTMSERRGVFDALTKMTQGTEQLVHMLDHPEWFVVRNVAELAGRSEEHTSELQSLAYLVCRLLLEKKKKKK